MNPMIKMLVDKALSDPEMLGNFVKSGIESLLKARDEAKGLRESVARSQAEILKLRAEFDDYRRNHP